MIYPEDFINKVICGDCLEVMKGIPENSIDAIVTDPPYGLEFMGKEWDKLGRINSGRSRSENELTAISRGPESYRAGIPMQEWHFQWAAEALRIAKPGCHLLAFGGTRTFHRLTCAIEDAGWEIRDCIFYCYGSGFPKSHNIGCKCRGGMIPYSHEKEGVDSGNLSNMREEISEAPMLGQENEESFLQLQLQRERTGEESNKIQRKHEGSGTKGQEIWSGESRMEGRSDILAEARELQTDKICPMSEGILGDGPQGRICNGASLNNGNSNRKTITQDGSRSSQKSRPAGQPNRKPRTIRVESDSQDSRICPTCGGLLDRIGYGSALKPAFEPIIIARKPLDGTLKQNCLKWGTGAINVDGCRIGTEKAGARSSNKDGITRRNMAFGMAEFEGNLTRGRWPANLIHDGSEEVLELFPNSKSGGREINSHSTIFKSRQFENYNPHDRNGSAARFFYCAKASRKEREMGCEGLEGRKWELQGRVGLEGKERLDGGKASLKCKGVSKNHHPTIKPLALMRYLCRLVTPPNGIILDPFMGSGTTGMAAKIERFRFVGIEKDMEYCEIARKRLE